MQNKTQIPSNVLIGKFIFLRPLSVNDCTEKYCSWLNDPKINRYLEIRWKKQSLEDIRKFVIANNESPENYLFAIIERKTNTHIGNLKLGPINFNHLFSDLSYFIGEPACWGKGYASEAIKLIEKAAFDVLKIYKIEASIYASNIASKKALINAGFKLERISKNRLKTNVNEWDDHHWYVKFKN